MKKIVLLTVILILLSTILFPCITILSRLQIAYASPYTDIDVEIAYNMIMNGSYPSFVVLDVRAQYEYDSGHIYGAVWIPHTELEARIGELAGHENDDIIVYCKSGTRSEIASGILDFYNFTKVYNILEGIDAWDSAGYPVWIATVHNINTTFNYDTIQAAIDSPQTTDGHIILVDVGTYYEHVVVNKSLILVGEDKYTTILDGTENGTVVRIKADNVSISSFLIQNSGCACAGSDRSGVYVESYHQNVNVTDNLIIQNGYGIGLNCTDSIILARNNITNNDYGVGILNYSSNNSIIGNLLTKNFYGIYLENSSNNIFFCNTVSKNEYGFYINLSSNNRFYFNNIMNNTPQVDFSDSGYTNIWDDGYPSGGNYWSDYNGTDSDYDGIGDTQHVINEYNIDRYPLMGIFHSFAIEISSYPNNVTETVEVITNSTVSDLELCAWLTSPNEYLQPGQWLLLFNITGEDDTSGFCRMMIPNNILNTSSYVVLINGQFVNSTVLLGSNSTHTYLYFNYTHSIHEVIITIPELPAHLALPLFMIATLIAVVVYRKRLIIRQRNP